MDAKLAHLLLFAVDDSGGTANLLKLLNPVDIRSRRAQHGAIQVISGQRGRDLEH
jgi:hypothetical protein